MRSARYDYNIGKYNEEEKIYYAGFYEHGASYKSINAFFEDNKICYIPEDVFKIKKETMCISNNIAFKLGYTNKKLIQECFNNIYTAFDCLINLEWEYPKRYYLNKFYSDNVFCSNCGGVISIKNNEFTCSSCNYYYDEETKDFKLDKTLKYFKDISKTDDIVYIDIDGNEYSIYDIKDICKESPLCKDKCFFTMHGVIITPIILAYMVFYHLNGQSVENMLYNLENNLENFKIF